MICVIRIKDNTINKDNTTCVLFFKSYNYFFRKRDWNRKTFKENIKRCIVSSLSKDSTT